MTQPRTRRGISAALVALALTLSGCAAPGQVAVPGVAAQWNGHEVTNADVHDIYRAWAEAVTIEYAPAQRRAVITVDMLGPEIVAAADELGYGVSESEATNLASQWVRFHGQDGEPSERMVSHVNAVFSLAVLAYVEPDMDTLRAIAARAEAEAELSPRTGEFSAETFMASVERAKESAMTQNLQGFTYTAFLNVNGFVPSDTPWIDRG